MSHTLEALLGDHVTSQGGGAVAVRSLCGHKRVLGLYFTATWSPPCRAFTPVLNSFYSLLKDQEERESLEIVQVSWDREEEGYRESTREVPWCRVDFDDKDRQRKLSRKFGVHGIPRLVLLDAETGRVITRDGYDRLTDDARGAGFPWRRKPLRDVIAGPLLQSTEEGASSCEDPGPDWAPAERQADGALQGQSVVGYYFSAHWCLPCRYFDPELCRAYKDLRARGVKFEVVFVSADRSSESFRRHCAPMPWLCLPFGDPRNPALKQHFGVDGIPMLVLVDDKGEVITMAGRQALSQDPHCKEFPWLPQPVEELTPALSLSLNEHVCAILFTDGSEAAMRSARQALAGAAQREADKGEMQDVWFFVAGEDEFSDQVRDFADLEDTVPLLVVLDAPDHSVYVCGSTDVTGPVAEDFINKFLRGELPPTPIPPMTPEPTDCGDGAGAS